MIVGFILVWGFGSFFYWFWDRVVVGFVFLFFYLGGGRYFGIWEVGYVRVWGIFCGVFIVFGLGILDKLGKKG